MKTYQIQLIWNKKAGWANFDEPLDDKGLIIDKAMELVKLGERKIRIINTENNFVIFEKNQKAKYEKKLKKPPKCCGVYLGLKENI